MNSDTPISIPVSKGKVALIFLGSCVFVALGFWVWSISADQTRYDPVIAKFAAVAGVLFFGLCAVYSLIKLFDKRPGLVIDEQGVVDNSSAVAAGRILWDEIETFRVSAVSGQRMLTIIVTDPQKFARRGNFLKRMMNAANTRLTGSPINISSNALGIKFDELEVLLSSALEEHQRGRKAR